jgi:hypothetical protein
VIIDGLAFVRNRKETVVPTFLDHLQEYLTRAGVVERMKPWDDAFGRVAEAWRGVCERIGVAMQRLAESAPSHGYEPLLVERGVSPIRARMMARLLVHRGLRIAEESKRYLRVVKAIRFLAKPNRRPSANAGKARLLLAASEETSIIETIFAAAGLDEREFIKALQLAAEGHQTAFRRLAEIATVIAPHASVPRGQRLARRQQHMSSCSRSGCTSAPQAPSPSRTRDWRIA